MLLVWRRDVPTASPHSAGTKWIFYIILADSKELCWKPTWQGSKISLSVKKSLSPSRFYEFVFLKPHNSFGAPSCPVPPAGFTEMHLMTFLPWGVMQTYLSKFLFFVLPPSQEILLFISSSPTPFHPISSSSSCLIQGFPLTPPSNTHVYRLIRNPLYL